MTDVSDSHQLRLFVDFDGTLTERDVGDGVFTRFMVTAPGEPSHEDLINQWKAGLLSSEECLIRESERVRVTPDEFHDELDRYSLTPGVIETMTLCRERNIPVAVLSDGMDYYIDYILKRHGLGDIPYYANHASIEGGRLTMTFPHQHRGCGRCGNCKRWHIEHLRHPGEQIIYVGDGYSDRFAIRSADIVFARRDLAAFCRAEGVMFQPFEDFYPVRRFLENGHGTV